MKWVKPSKIRGTVKAPPSKSMMGRALAASLLAAGTTTIENASWCDDASAAVDAIETLGATVSKDGDCVSITGTGKPLAPLRGVIDCRESGLTMRMLAPIAALAARDLTLVASGSLRARPMGMVEALRSLGVACTTASGLPPVTVKGPLRGGTTVIDGSMTSQFLTGLLMALPLCEEDSHITVSRLKSGPYVVMTLRLLGLFGIRIENDEGLDEFRIEGGQTYRPLSRIVIEGDWSGASFLLVAGATAGQVTVHGLDPRSAQADRAVLEALSVAGATVEVGADAVRVQAGHLRAFCFDASDCPDLFPPLAALASACHGRSVISGLGRLAHKESDRAAALRSEFQKLGISIEARGDTMEIEGGPIRGASVDSHKDHRIAMACAVAALRADGPVKIGDSLCVAKSYPGFFSDLEGLMERQ